MAIAPKCWLSEGKPVSSPAMDMIGATKPGKNFSKIEFKAAKKYGSKEDGKRVAGATLAKLRAKKK